MEERQTDTFLREQTEIRKPHMYVVVMYNDDFTPMDFVVNVLKLVFQKSEQEAYTLMMTVHKGGKSVVGKYTYDMALTRQKRAMQMAREEGYPFRVEVQKA